MAEKKEPLWWLSYADEQLDQSKGVAIVRARSFKKAGEKARELGISPGGQLKGFEAPPEYDSVLGPFENKHLSEAEALELALQVPDGEETN